MKRLSLFWKVYIGFLLALFLSLVVNEIFFTIEKSRHTFQPPEELQRLLTWSADGLAEKAGALLKLGDETALSVLLAQAEAQSGIFFSLLPPGEHRADNGQTPPGTVRTEIPVKTSGGTYTLLGELSLFRGRPPFPPRHWWMFLIPMGIGALLCLVLVRHIVSPILELRKAAVQLGRGDLGVRAGESVTGRGDHIADLGKAFDGMAERIQDLLTSQQRLMGDISHELRSPLQRLDVALTLARKGCAPEAAEFLDRAGRDAERMNEMVSQILSLSRAELYPREMDGAPVNIVQLLREITEDARFEGMNGGKTVAASNMPCTMELHGDEQLLRQAFENVIRNGLRATPSGGTLEIIARQKGNETVVTVRDQGPGIPEEELPRIFRPFYRLDYSRDRRSGGTGLGLAIAERAVRCHGGRISAGNFPDGGLIVEIALPLKQPEKILPGSENTEEKEPPFRKNHSLPI